MGCGKTTLGEALASEMRLTFIDLDEHIEQMCGMSIPEIFDKMGENRFRQLESQVLCDVAMRTDIIVGCGGGTPCYNDNMALMNDTGTTVWLITSAERITSRLLLPDQKIKRPKIIDIPDEAVLPIVKRELEERQPWYMQAQLQFDSTDIETAAATSRTAKRLANLLRQH